MCCIIADDGVRARLLGHPRQLPATQLTVRAMGEIVQEIGGLRPSRVDAFLDMPIAFSGLMAEELRQDLAGLVLPRRRSPSCRAPTSR